MEEEREMCQNCKKDIPVTNYKVHTLQCARNMVKCAECDMMIGTAEDSMQLHKMEFHTLRVCDQCQVSIEAYKLPEHKIHSCRVCDQCQVSIEAYKLPEHKKTLCSKRKLICKYCNLPKMAMEMSDHETYCGIRAERCDQCPDWVQLKEWDSHQSRYHATVNRRFRERSVIAQTETIIDYNASKTHNGENDRNVNNVSSTASNKSQNSLAGASDPMLPCEFCDGLVPMRKLLEHQAACVNPTNVRRNDSSCNSSCTSSFRSTSGRPQGLGQKLKKLSCAEQMALESPIPSPDMSASKKSASESRRKISAPASYQSNPTSCAAQIAAEEVALADVVAADEAENGTEKTKVPCEFCNEPCSLESLMRHQRTCKKNPHINANDMIEAKSTERPSRQRHYSLSRTQSVRDSSEVERPFRALSRQNSFSDRSSFRRSESFYGRNAMTLGSTYRSTYSSTDYASAVRRSSLFDGYAGFSIYSSISQGLDEITYGGRRSRAGSVSRTDYSAPSYSSRRGSVSTSNAGDYAALMAATAALEATSTSNNSSKQNEQKQQQQQNPADSESGLGNSPKSINLSRQNSTRMSNMSDSIHDSAYGEDYESSGSPAGGVTMHKIQKSSSLLTTSTTKKSTSSSSEVAVIKHSKSSGKLERKVSFSEADPIKIGCIAADATKSMALNNNNIIIECNNNVNNNVNNTEEISPAKPKRERKEKKDKEKIKTTKSAKKSASSSKLVSENELVDQVSAKLRLWEQQQQKVIVPAAEVVEVIDINPVPNSLDISATIKLSPKMNQRPKSQQNNPAINAILQDMSMTNGDGNNTTAQRREKVASRIGSKRNSLDKQSVQTLAQDLAAECAKAYALMENSLSKLSSELGVTPFGLAPKSKKLRKSSSTSTAIASRPQSAASAI